VDAAHTRQHLAYIIIHHSATPRGGRCMFDRIHKAKGWDELATTSSSVTARHARRQIEVGPRWRKQKWGAHAKTPDITSITTTGIWDLPRRATSTLRGQAPSATRRPLRGSLAFSQRTDNIPPERVFGHRQVVQHV
jgi:hypothetical protein